MTDEKKHVVVSNGDLISFSDLNITSKKKATIMYKINIIAFIIGMLVIALLVVWNKYTLIIGVIFEVVVCYIYFKMPNQKVMEIYTDRIIIFDTGLEGKVLQIMLDNLASFTCDMYEEGFNVVVLRTNDGDVIYCETFESNKANGVLKKLVPDKELRDQQQSQITDGSLLSKKKKKD